MTARERFIHFVCLFAPKGAQDPLVEEALGIDPRILSASSTDEAGDVEPSVLERPMDAAWEFVQHRQFGASRPHWYPAIVTAETRLIR